ncbi:MAG: hypothetical protein OXI17_09035 [Gammaproteobacteria bacterium]|nr:hypothetical protein [Gammaproteobacteria bacterium]
MKGDDLPDHDHVVRYVKPSMVKEDGTVDGADFQLRPNRPDDSGLSVNWLEVFGSDHVHQLDEVRRLGRLQLKANGRFAEINVGKVRSEVVQELETLRIVHDPLEAMGGHEADPSHAEITGLPPGDSDQALLIGDLIAECVSATHPAIVEHDL